MFSALCAAAMVTSVSAQGGKDMLSNGIKYLDVPYVAHTLEADGPEELVINCDEVDCTTLVEYVLAETLTPKLADGDISESAFADNLQKIRYRDGKIDGYTSRLHYIADWINNGVRNGFLQDVTGAMSPDTERLSISYMSSHPQLYKQLANSPENVAKMKKIEQSLSGKEIHYLPKAKLPADGLPWIKDGDIIAITTNTPGLDVAHMGIAFYADSKLLLVHASSTDKKVVVSKVPLSQMLKEDRETFDEMVNETLRRHFHVIKELVARGTYFFDYGNSFMKAIYDAGVKEISRNGTDEKDGFIWPSYVEDIMGPQLFDYGYGPFRWVCLSGKKEDLIKTDHAAMECIPKDRRGQDMDNWIWIRDAEKNNLVVGTQARILYQDALGRMNIALRFNEMVRRGEVGPIMLGRDHHDVSGTDSPFRETSNIKDGSNVMADMAVQCFAGNCARGMSLVALHNGGGVGIGKAINGGFGMVCDGSERVDRILRSSMLWDVMGGVARRSWARNPHAMETSAEFNESHADGYHITLPHIAEDDLINKVLKNKGIN